MKDGTGGDPFADDPIDTDGQADTDERADTDEPASSADSARPADGERTQSASGTASTAETVTDSTTTQSTTSDSSDASLPYYYRRDTVKEGRDQIPFFLRDHVQDLEDDFIADLEDRLNTSNVYKADAREAALQIVYENHPDEVADLLREWGYDR